MNNLRDMPMITVEQKNRFREAAMEVEQERDQLAELLEASGIDAKEIKEENERLYAELAQMRASLHEAMLITKDWYANEDDTGTCLGRLDAWSMRAMADPAAALKARDASMKAEAMVEASAICMSVEIGQRDMAYKHTEADDDGDEMVTGHGISYANKAMGAGHCRERLAELIAKYRNQADGES
jgi:hypothetical protein